MPTVYVINKGCHDYTAARKYGQIVYLTEGLFSRFSTSKMYRMFKHYVRDSGKHDLIVVGGLTVMTCVFCSMFAIKHGRLNLLLHNNGPEMEEHYVKRVLVLEDL